MPQHDRAAGAALLKRLRWSRGWSLRDTAQALRATAAALGQPFPSALSSVQRSVARWECTAPVLPGERYQVLLAHLYADTGHGLRSLGPGSDFAELLEAFALLGESEERLRQLRSLLTKTLTSPGAGLLGLLSPAAQSALSTALRDPSRADEDLHETLRGTVAAVNDQVGSVPFVRLQLLLAPVVESCGRLLDECATTPEGLREDLNSVAAEAFTLAGRLAFETRDDGAARVLYRAATTAAGALGSPWRRALVHMSNALVTLYSTPGLDAARSLVDAAVRDAQAGDSVAVRARTHALQAEVSARSGHERQAEGALDLARYDLQSLSADDPSPHSFTAAHLRGFEGLTALYVGAPSAAHETFAQTTAALACPRESVQRAIVATDQATARLRMGDPRAATSLLHECVTAASSTGGRVAALRLRQARRELRPWRREEFVAELDDHLIEALGG